MEHAQVIVDYSKIRYYHELHTILRDAMGWPKWYGCNLDALWDIFFIVFGPEKIIFIGTECIYQHEGWGESFEAMLRVLDDVILEYKRLFQEELSYEILS